MKKRDFTKGKIFGPMFTFALPIILTNLLQTTYNIADNVVVGKFSGDTLALAAVGTASSISAFVLNLVIGISVGAGVVVSQAYGAKDYEKVSRSVHTSLCFGLIFGLVVGALAFILAPHVLMWTGVKDELLSRATLYLRILFMAYPATAIYNFSASTLRAVGDSRTSLYILASSGILNVALNLVFVLFFHMSVGGVALATAISKYISAIVITVVLCRRKGEAYAFSFSKAKISREELLAMLRFGVPNSIQNTMFNLSNIFFTAALNGLDTYVLSAKTIAMNLTGVANNFSSSYMNAMVTFSAQNYGAKKPQRIQKSLLICVLQGAVITLSVGLMLFLFIHPISSLYIDSTDVNRELIMKCVREIGLVTLPYYWLCSVMNASSGALRGMGYSIIPMVNSILGICGFRLLWIFFAFPLEIFHSAEGIYLAFPISWGLVVIANFVCIFLVSGKVKAKLESERNAEELARQGTFAETKSV